MCRRRDPNCFTYNSLISASKDIAVADFPGEYKSPFYGFKRYELGKYLWCAAVVDGDQSFSVIFVVKHVEHADECGKARAAIGVIKIGLLLRSR